MIFYDCHNALTEVLRNPGTGASNCSVVSASAPDSGLRATADTTDALIAHKKLESYNPLNRNEPEES